MPRKPRLTPEEKRELNRRRCHEWYIRNAEREREKRRMYHVEHREEESARNAEYRKLNAEKIRKSRHESYIRNRDVIRARLAKFNREFPDAQAMYQETSKERRRERMRTDEKYRAAFRAKMRANSVKWIDAHGRVRKYVPRPQCRIPDWMTAEEARAAAARSTFNWANHADDVNSILARRQFGNEIWRRQFGEED